MVIETVQESSAAGQQGDYETSRAIPYDTARLYRAAIAGHDHVRQVRTTFAAGPPEPALQMRGHRPAGLWVSTLANQVGAAAFAVMPLFRLIEAHLLTAERPHGDETTVPILAKKTRGPSVVRGALPHQAYRTMPFPA